VKDAAGHVHGEGKMGSTRRELDAWIGPLPQPRMIALEATIFTGWIYDYLLPHAEKVKVAHSLMLRATAAAKKKNDPSVTWPRPRSEMGAGSCVTGAW
jgi:transposase